MPFFILKSTDLDDKWHGYTDNTLVILLTRMDIPCPKLLSCLLVWAFSLAGKLGV